LARDTFEIDILARGFANNTSFSIFGGVIKIKCITLALVGLWIQVILKRIPAGVSWFGLVMGGFQSDGVASQ